MQLKVLHSSILFLFLHLASALPLAATDPRQPPFDPSSTEDVAQRGSTEDRCAELCGEYDRKQIRSPSSDDSLAATPLPIEVSKWKGGKTSSQYKRAMEIKPDYACPAGKHCIASRRVDVEVEEQNEEIEAKWEPKGTSAQYKRTVETEPEYGCPAGYQKRAGKRCIASRAVDGDVEE
ncbi:hypothetical protein BDV96DRAFT_639617 [Lophiotrema nucula]|uniref:Uncharacterized protein n=1 Tax=Lophiotrema nucula TaxID=690887 RepID=A0A6A5ZU93_9PLEO|nr:hypothetical protein BDV96DRAFT_639617 [Lophiotrema nucula]